MNRVILMAWLVGEGIVVWRSFKKDKRPPIPGQLLATSGVFVLLALMSEAGPEAAKLAGTLGVGFDIAAAFNILPNVVLNSKGNVTTTTKAQSKTQVV